MTHIQALDHFEYGCRATFLIFAGFVLGWLIGYFVSDREVEDV